MSTTPPPPNPYQPPHEQPGYGGPYAQSQYPPGQYPPYRDLGDDPAMRMLLPVGRSGWAIAAGYLGLLSPIPIFAPLAIVMALVAMVDIKNHRERHGMGRAIFGLVMGILCSVFWIAILVATMVAR